MTEHQIYKIQQSIDTLGWTLFGIVNESPEIKNLNIHVCCQYNHELVLNYAKIIGYIRNKNNNKQSRCEICDVVDILNTWNYQFIETNFNYILPVKLEAGESVSSAEIKELLITYKCNEGHQQTEQYKDIIKKRQADVGCETCKIKNTIETLGWVYIDSDGSFTSKDTIVTFICTAGHQLTRKFIPGVKNLASLIERPVECHICLIEKVLKKLGWSFVDATDEHAIKNILVTFKCHNNHIMTMPYKTLQARGNRRESQGQLEPADCDQCYRHSPQQMYKELIDAGYKINRVPKDSRDVLEYICPQCNENTGRIFYASFLQHPNRGKICVSCSKITTMETLTGIKGTVLCIKRNRQVQKADITIKCSQCNEEYTCILSNLKSSSDTTRCAKCKHKDQLNDLEYVKTEIVKKGVEWVGDSNEYSNRRARLTLKCSCGTTFDQNLANIRKGRKFCCDNKETAISVLDKYGVDCMFKLPSKYDKKSYTNKEFYGHTNWLQSGTGKKYMMDIYGVENAMHHPDLFYKNMVSNFKIKYYDLPSGTLIPYMGYENYALDVILTQYTEGNIINDKRIPRFTWYCEEDKKHIYTPDIMLVLQPINLIIEVKSFYTYEKGMEDGSLPLKIQAVRKENYYAEVWIIDNKQVRQIQTINDDTFIDLTKSICGITIN